MASIVSGIRNNSLSPTGSSLQKGSNEAVDRLSGEEAPVSSQQLSSGSGNGRFQGLRGRLQRFMKSQSSSPASSVNESSNSGQSQLALTTYAKRYTLDEEADEQAENKRLLDAAKAEAKEIQENFHRQKHLKIAETGLSEAKLEVESALTSLLPPRSPFKNEKVSDELIDLFNLRDDALGSLEELKDFVESCQYEGVTCLDSVVEGKNNGDSISYESCAKGLRTMIDIYRQAIPNTIAHGVPQLERIEKFAHFVYENFLYKQNRDHCMDKRNVHYKTGNLISGLSKLLQASVKLSSLKQK